MRVLTDIYKVYINNVLLPQTPESITISNSNNNEVITLANGQSFTLPRLDSPQKFEFEFEITQKAYPWTFQEAMHGIRFFTDMVWQIKQDRNPIPLTITRTRGQPPTNVTVLLDDYSYTEDANNASDYKFKVTFTEWHPQNNQELDTNITHHLITAGYARGWVDEVNKEELAEEKRIEDEKAAEEAEKQKKLEEKEQAAEERKAEGAS